MDCFADNASTQLSLLNAEMSCPGISGIDKLMACRASENTWFCRVSVYCGVREDFDSSGRRYVGDSVLMGKFVFFGL